MLSFVNLATLPNKQQNAGATRKGINEQRNPPLLFGVSVQVK
jgi:hypothetical protein